MNGKLSHSGAVSAILINSDISRFKFGIVSFVLLITMLLFHQVIKCQNLVANHQFVDRNTCQEHGVQCAPEAWFLPSPNIPLYNKRDNLVGIIVFNSSLENRRQYLQTELLMDLKEGKDYEITIRLKAGNCAIKSLGIKFSENLLCMEKDELIEYANVDFSNELKKVRKRRQKELFNLTFTYNAKGGERFLLFGSFTSDKEQHRVFYKRSYTSKPLVDYKYYIDMIEIKAVDLNLIPIETERVRAHLYDFNYRHSFCMYKPYIDAEHDFFDSIVNVFDLPLTDTLILEDVLFDFNSSKLKVNAETYIMKVLDKIPVSKIDTIEVYGYTDNMGNPEYNLVLSKKRAEAVKEFLVTKGVDRNLITTYGMGESNPIVDNLTGENRSKNRRIELFIHH